MDFRRQRYFIAVAQHLGFRRAASVLNVSQPAVSQQIRLLEEDLGIALIERTPRAIKLTAAGTEYYKGLLAMFAELDHWVKRARDAQAGGRGTLTVAANAMLLVSHFPKIVPAFREAYPDVRLELSAVRAPDAIRILRDERADLVLSGQVLADEGVTVEPFCEFPWNIVLPLDHRLAQAADVDLKALSGETLLIPSHFATLLGHEDVLAICREQGMQLGEVCVVPGDAATGPVCGLVACGFGFAFAAGAWANQFPIVKMLPIAGLQRRLEISACWRTDGDNPLIANFLMIARRTIAEIAQPGPGSPQ